jgi:Phosphotransferase enzyme family
MSGVLRSQLDVTPAVLTDALRRVRWIPDDVTVVDAGIATIGAGQMGICARYDLRFDRGFDDAPTSVVGKFAASDEQARTFMSSSGYPNEVAFYRDFASQVTIRVPRCALAVIDDDGWFTLLLEDLSPMQPGDQLQGCTVPQVEAAVQELVGLHAPLWDAPVLREHPQFSSSGLADPGVLADALQAVVPGFVERYGLSFEPDEVDFYERLATSARGWIEARPPARSLVHSDFRPDNLMFGTGPDGAPRSPPSTGKASDAGARCPTCRSCSETRSRLTTGAPTKNASCATTTARWSPPASTATRGTSAGTSTRARCCPR